MASRFRPERTRLRWGHHPIRIPLLRNWAVKSIGAVMGICFSLGDIPVFAATPGSGTLLIVDSTAGTNAHGAIFSVNPQTGLRTLLSDFGNPSQGVQGVDPEALAWVPATLLTASSSLLVVDGSAGTNALGALFSVDPSTGQRSLVSDFGNSDQGPLGSYPISVSVAPSGLVGLGSSILVLDAFAGTNGQGALFTVNPQSGQRKLLSDFGDSTKGPTGVYPDAVAVLSPGLLGLGTSLIVTDGSAGTNGLGALFSVNPTTGQRTLVSDFGLLAEGNVDPNLNSYLNSVATIPAALLEPTTMLVVTDTSAGTNELGTLVKVNPSTGIHTILSDFGDSAQGPLGADPDGVLIQGSNFLVVDGSAGTNSLGAIFSVNSTTGQRMLLSDFGNLLQGPLGSYPTGITVVP